MNTHTQMKDFQLRQKRSKGVEDKSEQNQATTKQERVKERACG